MRSSPVIIGNDTEELIKLVEKLLDSLKNGRIEACEFKVYQEINLGINYYGTLRKDFYLELLERE